MAFQFILLLGAVSLFADITYEGARSVTGPYLAILGASAGVVGLVAGLGEYVGYALRLVSGYVGDRTKGYWLLTVVGYGLIFSIPLLAFAASWQLAAFLIILERMGKAIRTPARDTMLSHATKQVGRGWGFGVHEALDQVGALIGPLAFSAVFILGGGYSEGFNVLWIPALLCLSLLLAARARLPSPEGLEASRLAAVQDIKGEGRLPPAFWLYVSFIFLSVAGFAHFQIISYHLKVRSIVSDPQIPVFYAFAMGVDALVALVVGKAYDKIGLSSLAILPLLTIPIPFLAFSQGYVFAMAGVVLWGVVMGAHETISRAAVADLTPIERRGFAYGVFNTAFGASWLVGSALMGLLYELSFDHLILFVVLVEVASVPSLLLLKKADLLIGKRYGES